MGWVFDIAVGWIGGSIVGGLVADLAWVFLRGGSGGDSYGWVGIGCAIGTVGGVAVLRVRRRHVYEADDRSRGAVHIGPESPLPGNRSLVKYRVGLIAPLYCAQCLTHLPSPLDACPGCQREVDWDASAEARKTWEWRNTP